MGLAYSKRKDGTLALNIVIAISIITLYTVYGAILFSAIKKRQISEIITMTVLFVGTEVGLLLYMFLNPNRETDVTAFEGWVSVISVAVGMILGYLMFRYEQYKESELEENNLNTPDEVTSKS